MWILISTILILPGKMPKGFKMICKFNVSAALPLTQSLIGCRAAKIKNTFIRRVLVYLISYVLPESLVHKLLIGNKYDVEIAFLEGIPSKIISGSKNKNSLKYAWVHTDLYNNYSFESTYILIFQSILSLILIVLLS